MKTVGTRLRVAREKKGWTQTYVCKKLDISNSTLSGYERDYRKPDPDQLRTFADLYEVSTDYLLGLTDDPRRPVDMTHEGLDVIQSGDIEKMIEMMENLNALHYKGKIIKGAKKEIIMEFLKEMLLPSIIEDNKQKSENNKQK